MRVRERGAGGEGEGPSEKIRARVRVREEVVRVRVREMRKCIPTVQTPRRSPAPLVYVKKLDRSSTGCWGVRER